MSDTPVTANWLSTVPGKAAAFGVFGWVGENIFHGPRYSQIWRGHHVPFLPVYAAGGAAVGAIAPNIQHFPMPLRAAVYGAIATGIELAACHIDRKVLNARSWDYKGRDKLADKTDGCVSWRTADVAALGGPRASCGETVMTKKREAGAEFAGLTGKELSLLQYPSAAWKAAYGSRGNRGPQTASQAANFRRVQDYNRGLIGIGRDWNN